MPLPPITCLSSNALVISALRRLPPSSVTEDRYRLGRSAHLSLGSLSDRAGCNPLMQVDLLNRADRALLVFKRPSF